MATRTTGAIALRPTGNDQGGYYFFSLATSRRLNRNRWTALSMPAKVIDRVHTLARAGNALAGMAFTDRNGHQVIDDDNDADNVSYDPDDDSAHNDGDDDHLLHDDDHVIAGVYDTINQNENIDLDEPDNSDEPDNFALDEEAIEIENENESEEGIEIVNEDPTINDNQETDHPTIQDMEDQYGAQNEQYNLRPRRPRDYRHLHHILESTVLTQHSVKGLQKFGDAGVNAVLKELQQLHMTDKFWTQKGPKKSQSKNKKTRYVT
jgi:hypothetical protein